MQACPMLALEDRTLAADDLYRVEYSVPEADADKGETASQRPLLGNEHVVADNDGDNTGDDRRHGQKLPVALVNEHAEIFAQIDPELGETALMLFILHAGSPSFCSLTEGAGSFGGASEDSTVPGVSGACSLFSEAGAF